MDERTRLDIISRIDFGELDGLFDPKLEGYFIDFGYWDEIIARDKFFVIGRKGTGKSAIYKWIEIQCQNRGALVSNLSFNNFPFEKFLSLSDDDFALPYQYQSIWRNIILSELARLIVIDQSNAIDENHIGLKKYVDIFFGEDSLDIYRRVVERTQKTTSGLQKIVNIGKEDESKKQFITDYSNVTNGNRFLEGLIIAYLKTNENNCYLVQFDQLDDNFNQYSDKEKYFQCLLSLFKAVYNINQTFRNMGVKSRAILFIRSDIYSSMHQRDPESARWVDFAYYLNWAIITQRDWSNPKLLQILNKRIKASLPAIKEPNPFYQIFASSTISVPVFQYIINRSFHRPRDIIKFAKSLQEEIINTKKYDRRTVKDAERKYSLWFLTELENEIGYRFIRMEDLYEFLRLLGSETFTYKEFSTKYQGYESRIQIVCDELIHILYDHGIICNINDGPGGREYYSIIRNERSRFNRDLRIQIYKGFWEGLHIIKRAGPN